MTVHAHNHGIHGDRHFLAALCITQLAKHMTVVQTQCKSSCCENSKTDKIKKIIN